MPAGHVGLGPDLVDEHQALGVKPALMRLPPGPAAGNVGAILLAGVQAFFKRDLLVLEEAPHRAIARRCPTLGELRHHRAQGQIRFTTLATLTPNNAAVARPRTAARH